uniref:PLA2c domain-containing protein n=1 Tax=Sinocyclocheilus rhinocerous TaxID=307959 RepID=A0A673K0K1_9TELE
GKKRLTRIAHALHTKEEEFVVKRRETVFQSLQKHEIHCSQIEVPHIALLGSGGGQRAMVGLLGSLVQLDKAGLLDCILYLSGVSGSTWCMASLYQEPDWSTKLETVKDNIIKRLSGPAVSWGDEYKKLKKYYNGKHFFSLTDVWAAIVITTYMKEVSLPLLPAKLSALPWSPAGVPVRLEPHWSIPPAPPWPSAGVHVWPAPPLGVSGICSLSGGLCHSQQLVCP